jgi:hypothetical protein
VSIGRADRLLLALLLALYWCPAGAVELGTLFNTPQERDRLDRLRRGEPEPAAAEASPSRAVGRPMVTGFVKRSDGRHTVWIDGTPVTVATPEAAKTIEALPAESATRAPDVRFERKSSEQPPARKAP